MQDIPTNRLQVLARTGMGSKATALARLSEPKRTATLVAVVRHLEAVAVDDTLDLFALLIATRFQPGSPRFGRADPAPVQLARPLVTLDAAWKQTAARLGEAGEDARARVLPGPDGRARLHVDHLEALGEPDSLVCSATDA